MAQKGKKLKMETVKSIISKAEKALIVWALIFSGIIIIIAIWCAFK